MRFHADLHVHSKYSRATSRDLDRRTASNSGITGPPGTPKNVSTPIASSASTSRSAADRESGIGRDDGVGLSSRDDCGGTLSRSDPGRDVGGGELS